MMLFYIGCLIGIALTIVIRGYIENTPVRRLMAERNRNIRALAMTLVIERGYRFNYVHGRHEYDSHKCAMCHAENQYMAECATRTRLMA